MILILSDEDDFSTNHVIDWISFWQVKFIRINRTDKIIISWIKFNHSDPIDFELIMNGNRIKYSEIDSFWYRRGYLVTDQFEITESFLENPHNENILEFFREEISDLVFLIYKLIELKNGIGSFYDNDINKLWVLIKARAVGLQIPESQILTNISQIDNKSKKYITKGIRHGLNFEDDKNHFGSYTEEINIEKIPSEDFFPSLLQLKLDKFFELRIFYLRKTFYTEAIFSQNDPKTSTDFRKYNHIKPNRTVRFDLPQEIKTKLINLMENLRMESGSIDMVYTKSGDYVFLEVNPVG